MIKPQALKPGDKVAIVSPSSGLGGEPAFQYRYQIGIDRIKKELGLEVVTMPHALSGIQYNYENPKERAEELMDAFLDPTIKAIICVIGGDDSVRLLPYIDFNIIKNHPKIFMGYSDITALHMMMYHAGVVSFQGPCVLVEFAENVAMHEYTLESLKRTLFERNKNIPIISSPEWTSELLDWTNETNQNIKRKMNKEVHGYELLQGSGIVTGQLIGGCLGVLQMINGTSIWPAATEWNKKILFLETAEDYPTPDNVCYFLRNLAAQGIFDQIRGIIVGKPLDEKYYDEYKEVYQKVIGFEAGHPELPILYNVNCSHTSPINVIPYGIEAEINCNNLTFTILDSPVC